MKTRVIWILVSFSLFARCNVTAGNNGVDQDTFDDSHTVVIAVPIATTSSTRNSRVTIPDDYADKMEVVETTFVVSTVLKGKHLDKLSVFHLKWKLGAPLGGGHPSLTKFGSKRETWKLKDATFSVRPRYLLFLDDPEENKFVLTGENADMLDSVKRVLPAATNW